MRLDHLLSKEHFLAAFGLSRGRFIGECPVLVAHGWNVDYLARSDLMVFKYCFGVERSSGMADGAWHVVGYLKVRP